MVSMNQSAVPMRMTASGGTAAMFPNMYVKIQSIDTDSKVAHCVTQVRGTKQISLTHQIGKGEAPKAGETWLVTSMFGDWMFVAQVDPETVTLVRDDDSRLSDARTPTGAAGGILGGTYPNPDLADTGWITSGVTIGTSNSNTVVGYNLRKVGHTICIDITWTQGTNINVPADGDVGNYNVCTLPAPFIPTVTWSLQSSAVGPDWQYIINRVGGATPGLIQLCAVTPDASQTTFPYTLASGTSYRFSGCVPD